MTTAAVSIEWYKKLQSVFPLYEYVIYAVQTVKKVLV